VGPKQRKLPPCTLLCVVNQDSQQHLTFGAAPRSCDRRGTQVKFMAFDPSPTRAVLGISASQPAAPGHSESIENIDKINIPREELEDVVLAELQRSVVGADVREVAIFGASGLRSGATWIVASFLPGSSEAERSLETVRHVEADLQSKYDMMLGS
jgi:hypothetical protein